MSRYGSGSNQAWDSDDDEPGSGLPAAAVAVMDEQLMDPSVFFTAIRGMQSAAAHSYSKERTKLSKHIHSVR